MQNTDVKISIMGSIGTGKSTFISNFLNNKEKFFDRADCLTIHEQIIKIENTKLNEEIKLLIWNHPSKKKYLSLSKM